MRSPTEMRRQFLGAALAAALGAAAGMAAGPALAAPPVVEIVAMPHPPVRMALASLRDWLAQQGGRVVTREIDIESPEGVKRMQAAGLSGHIPILILIDGQHRHPRRDGGRLEFVNFPNVPGTPPGARGEWTTADVQAVVLSRIK
ncbi:MAG: hypothetical protein HY778_00880 [Betaproteobacteria bacterium]|nr:hypothetical protein [Betaproteobacteria bacterium]